LIENKTHRKVATIIFEIALHDDQNWNVAWKQTAQRSWNEHRWITFCTTFRIEMLLENRRRERFEISIFR
jgi:hypothetical protein